MTVHIIYAKMQHRVNVKQQQVHGVKTLKDAVVPVASCRVFKIKEAVN